MTSEEKFPFATEVETAVDASELQIIAETYNKELSNGQVRPQTKFDYAWALVRSRFKSDQQQGVKLLKEIYKENPSRRRECLYYLALGEYKLGNYKEARNYNSTLLQMEPKNGQALHLANLIDEKVRSEGLVGMAIVGAAVATVGILAGLLLGGGQNKK